MDLDLVIESLLFASPKPLSAPELKELCHRSAEHAGEEGASLPRPTARQIDKSLQSLEQRYQEMGRSYRLHCVAGGWQFVNRTEFAPWIRAMLGRKPRPPRLSQPALETLAIVAYRQPLTRAEAEHIRGVSVDGVVQTLLERNLIEPLGRAEVAGRPMTYGTTGQFLEYFGLASLEDLPDAPELQRIEAPSPGPPPREEEAGDAPEAAPENHAEDSSDGSREDPPA